MKNRKGINSLTANYLREIQSQISEGYLLTWDSYKIEPYVSKFYEIVNNYQVILLFCAHNVSNIQERVEELIYIVDNIDSELAALDTCQFSEERISGILSSIQKSVDQLSYGNYSNLNEWVESLDKQVCLLAKLPILVLQCLDRSETC